MFCTFPEQMEIGLEKLFGGILYQNILDFFHGLTLIMKATARALDYREQLDVVLTNFAKAFDRVDHALMVAQLGKFDFSSNAHTIMISYLTMGTQ
ncbi:hypothetical protein WA026_008412 [Henosepilachna vigintioctopunctata]|uniref:Reverse transcriptase domain-containing protein n=1 Tax=Henosepilachna vigintioctopunctata TaxID=420089 RepID=A0AAW1U8H9_9CUCU